MSTESTRGGRFRTETRGGRSTRGSRGGSRLGRTGSRLSDTRTYTRTVAPAQRRKIVARRTMRLVRRRIARAWQSVTQAVTPLGWLVFALTAAGFVLGIAYAWLEAWVVALAGALLIVVALPFLIGSRAYRVGIELERTSVVVGGEVGVTLRIENNSARPALPAVAELPVGEALREITVPFIGPHSSVELPITVAATQRGVVRVGPLTVARQDPVGLLRREVTWPERHLLYVHPETTPLPPNSAGLVRDLEGNASRRITDSDLSFYAVREYVRGDAMRHVHWKSTAKMGELMVRQYEESQTARVAVLFDARPEDYVNVEEFELGVSIAASLSVQAVREGRERFVASAWAPGRVRPSIDGLEELPSRDPKQLLNAWSELETAPDGLPFEVLARGLAQSPRNLSIVAIVTGSQAEQTRIRRAAVSFPPDVHVLAVRCELHAEPRAQRIDPLTMFTAGALGDLPQMLFRSAE